MVIPTDAQRFLNGCLITGEDKEPRTNTSADEIVQIKINGSANRHEDAHFHLFSVFVSFIYFRRAFFYFQSTYLCYGNLDILFVSEKVIHKTYFK